MMLEGSYGKEPFDLRLTALRMMRNLDKIFVFTLVGTILFGGGYYVKNVLFRGEVLYTAASVYKVEYADPDWAGNGTYINAATWNTHVHTEEFLGMVEKHLGEAANLEGVLFADVPSDLRVLTTTVTSADPDTSVRVAKAVEKALTQDFPKVTTEVSAIRVTDPAFAAAEEPLLARPGRAFALSAILSFFFTAVILLLKETGDDSIWLPAAIRRRYGVPVVGTIHTKELKVNMDYLFRGMEKIAVCTVDGSMDPVKVTEKLTELLDGNETEGADDAENTEAREHSAVWIPVPAPRLTPEICDTLRGMDGILLAVRAGSHSGKPFEYVKEFLEQQDCKITAVILWDADEFLIKSYYKFRDIDKLEE